MEKLTIKRKWDNAEIKLSYNSEGVTVECSVDDFVKAFVNNIPKMAWDFKTKTINAKCKEVLLQTIKELKTETLKIAR